MKYQIDFDEEKMVNRLKKVQKEKARELMENPNVDIRMYSYVLE